MIRTYRKPIRLRAATYVQGNCPTGYLQNADVCTPVIFTGGQSATELPGQPAALPVLAAGKGYTGSEAQITNDPAYAASLPQTLSPPSAAAIAQAATPPPPSPPVSAPVVTSTSTTGSATPLSESAQQFDYTADVELVQNTMYEYGDNWDNAETIVENLYAQGVAPGTITQTQALNAMTGIPAATAAAPASTLVLTSPSTWPWYLWAGGAAALFFLFDSGGKRK